LAALSRPSEFKDSTITEPGVWPGAGTITTALAS
jgi:hypothetical protein